MAALGQADKTEGREPRTIAILAYEGLQSLDLTGPLEVRLGDDAARPAPGDRAQVDAEFGSSPPDERRRGR